RKPSLVTFIGKGGRVASGKQRAVHSFALRGKRTEVRKCVFHVAESAQNRAAIAGDGLFISSFGCFQIRAVASTLENRDGKARPDQPYLAGPIEERTKIGAGKTSRTGEFD